MNTKRGFIALSEKEKHARMSGVYQGFGMHGHTFLQMDCDSLTALPFSGLSRGKTVFSCAWQLGAQRETGEQAKWVSQSISIYITQFIWQQRPCSSHSSLQIREGTGESSGELEYCKNKKVTSIVVEENRDMWEIFCWQGVTWGAKTTET